MICSKLAFLLLLFATLLPGFSQPIFSLNEDEVADDEVPLLPVNGHLLEDMVDLDDLRQGAQSLYHLSSYSVEEYDIPTRVIGSIGHHATLHYITRNLKALGDYYDFHVQEFNATYGKVFSHELTVNGDKICSSSVLRFSPSIDMETDILWNIANLGCNTDDFPPDLKGGIALVQRGGCSFAEKSKLVKALGGSAVIIYNDVDGPLHGTLSQPDSENGCEYAATFGISNEDGMKIRALVEDGEESCTVDIKAQIDACLKRVLTTNIIAETKEGDHDNVVMLGAHSDSVAAGPGINDNGSGTISLLALAKYLTNFEINNAVRFAWWSAEEEGLLGSNYYTDTLEPEENKKIRLFLDYDMLASPNYAYQVYDSDDKTNPKGSSDIRDLYISWYEAKGLKYKLIPFDGRSDYVGFIKNSIPAGGTSTGAEGIKTEEESQEFGGEANLPYDQCYHALCDDIENLNYEAWEVNSKLIAYSLGTYADSLEGFPQRNASDLQLLQAQPNFQYMGDRLVY